MKPVWRGVLLNDGTIWAWPTLLMQHTDAFDILPHLSRECKVRWRQWNPGEPVDFDGNPSPEDRAKINAWVKAANAVS